MATNRPSPVTPLERAISACDDLSPSDLRKLYDTIIPRLKAEHAVKQAAAARAFKPGEIAKFTDHKTGRLVKITIVKINRTSVSGVEVGGTTNWRVSPGLLELV